MPEDAPTATPSPARTCLLVLGMHRSGSSAVAGSLHLLGATMPENLLGADAHNPTGHWEPLRIVDLNDRLLFEASSRWDDWQAFDAAHLPPGRWQAYKAELRALIAEEYREASLFVLKDPRLCRLAGLYLEVFGELGIAVKVLIPLRDPAAVARSLQARGGMAVGYAELLWLRHVLDAERLTRRLPHAVFSYEAMLADPEAVLTLAASRIGLDWPAGTIAFAAVRAHLSRDLDHAGAASADTVCGDGLARRAHDAMRRLEAGEAVRDILDTIGREFAEVCRAAGAVQSELVSREDRALRRILALEQERGEVAAELTELELLRRVAEDLARVAPRQSLLSRAVGSPPPTPLPSPPPEPPLRLSPALVRLAQGARRAAGLVRRSGPRVVLVKSWHLVRTQGVGAFVGRARDAMANDRRVSGFVAGVPGPQALVDERALFIAEHGLTARAPASVPAAHPSLVVIVADTLLPQCYKFRVLDKIAILATLGVRAVHVSPQDLYSSLNVLQFASAVIFYRLPFNDLFALHCDEARRLGLRVFYDIDDPIFDATVMATNASLSRVSADIRFGQIMQAPSFARALGSVDCLLASTPALAGLMSETALRQGRRLPSFVWRNAIDDIVVTTSRPRPSRSAGRLTLGYFSGSLAHEADFDVALPALLDLLHGREDVDLLVGGHAAERPELAALGSRLSRLPFSDYAAYLDAVAACDLVLVPLADDSFNACKSGVRFLDAAAVGCPVLASAVGDFPGLIAEGATGWLARPAEWAAQLAAVLADPAALRTAGAAAQAHVAANFTLSRIGTGLPPALLDALRGRV